MTWGRELRWTSNVPKEFLNNDSMSLAAWIIARSRCSHLRLNVSGRHLASYPGRPKRKTMFGLLNCNPVIIWPFSSHGTAVIMTLEELLSSLTQPSPQEEGFHAPSVFGKTCDWIDRTVIQKTEIMAAKNPK